MLPSSTHNSGTVAQNRDAFEKVAELFKVFADATRLSILQCLKRGPMSVGELVESVGMTQANISKHLSILHDAHILKREKRGTSVIYSIDDEFVFPLCKIICDKLNRETLSQEPFQFSI